MAADLPTDRAHQHHHGSHQHSVDADADQRLLTIAAALIGIFMIAEVSVGVLSHSLALIADAGHMLTDAAALSLAVLAIRLTKRPAQGRLTFGLHRVEALSGQINGASLLLISGFIFYQGIAHLIHPVHSQGLAMVIVAVIGVGVNGVATRLLAQAQRDNLAIEGSFRHLLSDLQAFSLTALAGLIILLTGFTRADAIASLCIGLILVRSAWGLLKTSATVLLEAAPDQADPAIIGPALVADPDVVEVHDLHVWELGSQLTALSAHILVHHQADCHQTRERLATLLATKFSIAHSTLQVAHAHDELLSISDVRTPVADPTLTEQQ